MYQTAVPFIIKYKNVNFFPRIIETNKKQNVSALNEAKSKQSQLFSKPIHTYIPHECKLGRG